MEQMVSMSIDLHLFFVFLTLALALINLWIIKKIDNYVDMTKKVEMFTPAYYLSLSIVIFTGFVVMAAYRFHTVYTAYLMIAVSVYIIVTAFKANRLFKKTRIRDKNSQKVYREFAIKKYLVDIALMVLTIVIAFMFAT